MNQASLDEHVQLFGALSDATRLRLLSVLAAHELSVVELTQATELGQSKVSVHLGRLKELGLVTDRKVGTSAFYRLSPEDMSPLGKQLWESLRASLDDAALAKDLARAKRVVLAREQKSWPERMAGELERHYSPGRTWESLARAFAGLVRTGSVLDIGAGDGTIAEMLAARARRYVCLEQSETLVAAAKKRLAQFGSAEVIHGDMHALGFEDGSFDHVLLLNVLTYAEQPSLVLREAGRVLAPGGNLVLVTVAKHAEMEIASQYGHRQPGFSVRTLSKQLQAQGLLVHQAAITARERVKPHFEIITCFAEKKRTAT
jgi:ArsR family transcriptional regulator